MLAHLVYLTKSIRLQTNETTVNEFWLEESWELNVPFDHQNSAIKKSWFPAHDSLETKGGLSEDPKGGAVCPWIKLHFYHSLAKGCP